MVFFVCQQVKVFTQSALFNFLNSLSRMHFRAVLSCDSKFCEVCEELF
jgi:hypothetical protein